MTPITSEQFSSTSFILENQWLLNSNTVPNYNELAAHNNDIRSLVHPSPHPLSKWMVDNIRYEVRRYDCLYHPIFVDPDPIPELFPASEMVYIAFVMDPYAVEPLHGITDPTQLQKLYGSKFGPGTPQSFLCEHLILGWVMYYDFGEWAWISEVQANNTLSGGILNRPSNRRHFYRQLLSTALAHLAVPCAMLTASEIVSLHQLVRPGKPAPPQVPYHSDIVEWCGMSRSTISDIPIIVDLDPHTTIWQTFHSA